MPTDICFCLGDKQGFIIELAAGSLNAPVDILAEASGRALVEETSGGIIFITD